MLKWIYRVGRRRVGAGGGVQEEMEQREGERAKMLEMDGGRRSGHWNRMEPIMEGEEGGMGRKGKKQENKKQAR